MVSSSQNRSVSWGVVTVMGSNSVTQIDPIDEGCTQPLIPKHPGGPKIHAFIVNNLEHITLRERPKVNGSSLFNPPVYSTRKKIYSTRKRLARASPPNMIQWNEAVREPDFASADSAALIGSTAEKETLASSTER